jgi:hypothetical protein
MTPRRILIADPGLSGPLGHHLGYSQAVAEAAIARGIAPLVLAGAGFTGRIAEGRIPARPAFAARYQSAGGGGGLRRLVFHAASFLPGPMAGWVAPPLRALRRWRGRTGRADGFGAELAAALAAEGAGAEDAVLLHSVSAANLAGLQDGPAPLLVVLRRMAHEMDADDAAPEPILALLPKLASRFGARLRLFADTEDLAARYAAGTGLAVRPVPLPVVVPPVATRADGGLPHVVFAGGARGEKGYHFLPAAIAACRGRARFTVQSGAIGPGDDPLVQRAHRALRGMAGPGLTLIERGLDPEGYLALLAAADLLFLPYDGAAYGARSSGILAESLALGVPAVVPGGCWMADAAGPDRAVVIAPGRDAAAALALALDRLPALAEAARHGAGAWHARHNPDALLTALLAPP